MPKRSEIQPVQTQDPMSQIPRGSALQDVFGWTIPVEQVPLPSGGMIYPVDNPLHGRETLQIKAMTALEEDILLSNALIKEGTVTQHLIRSCLIDKTIDPRDLLSGDRNALVVSIRITGYGSDYRAIASCASCGKSDNYSFDLSQLGIKRLGASPVRPGANEFSFLLPVSKKQVIFKLTTVRDEDEERVTKEKMKKLFPDAKQDGAVTKMLESQTISIDGKTDRVAISAFIKAMPAGDSRAYRSYISKIEPGLDMNLDINCRSCGAESKVAVPMGASFFWPE